MVSHRTDPGGDRQTRRRFDVDERVLRDLFERHWGSVFSVALLVTGERQVAGEITRRVFAQLWRGRNAFPAEFGPNGLARSWLRNAARAEGLAWLSGRHEPARETRGDGAERLCSNAPWSAFGGRRYRRSQVRSVGTAP